MKDGHLGQCRACQKEYMKLNRDKNIEHYREQDRNRPYRKSTFYKKYPTLKKIHAAVGHAIRSVKLKKEPCMVCGNLNAEAHHDDYSKPLDVKWLCCVHHNKIHDELKRMDMDPLKKLGQKGDGNEYKQQQSSVSPTKGK